MRRDIVITRQHIGQLSSYAAGLALLLGLLGALWQGGLTPVIIALLAAGGLFVALWAYMTPQDFFGFITGRHVRYSTGAIFSVLLLTGIVALSYIFVQRQVITLDMTIDRRFSLSNETLEILEGLERSDRDIQITAFYTPQDLLLREVDDQYWRLYEEASGGRIHRVYIDPLVQPAIANRYLRFLEQGYNVFIAFVNPDGTLDFNSTTVVNRTGRQERDMTEAILRLLITGTYHVYFETSLGTFNALDESQRGLSIVNQLIQINGMVTAPFDLELTALTGGRIPREASVMLLPRPTRQLTPQEIAVLDAYLNEGGSLFIMADFLFSDDLFLAEDSLFSRYLWERFGLRPLDAVVVDPASSLQTELDIISAAVFTDNDIGRNLNQEGMPETSTLFRLARPIEVRDDPPVLNGRVVMSSSQSWGETNLADLAERNAYRYDEGQDIPGPLTTVAWAWNTQTNAKILLVGDAEFITNGQIQSPHGNTLLFLDGIGWLTDFTSRVQFTPQAIITTPIIFVGGGQTLDLIAFITVVLMPGAMLAAAVFVWLRRVRS